MHAIPKIQSRGIFKSWQQHRAQSLSQRRRTNTLKRRAEDRYTWRVQSVEGGKSEAVKHNARHTAAKEETNLQHQTAAKEHSCFCSGDNKRHYESLTNFARPTATFMRSPGLMCAAFNTVSCPTCEYTLQRLMQHDGEKAEEIHQPDVGCVCVEHEN